MEDITEEFTRKFMDCVLEKPGMSGYNVYKCQNDDGRGVLNVNMTENARLILGLRARGWSDTEITDFILWIETGDEQYRPRGEDFEKNGENQHGL